LTDRRRCISIGADGFDFTDSVTAAPFWLCIVSELDRSRRKLEFDRKDKVFQGAWRVCECDRLWNARDSRPVPLPPVPGLFSSGIVRLRKDKRRGNSDKREMSLPSHPGFAHRIRPKFPCLCIECHFCPNRAHSDRESLAGQTSIREQIDSESHKRNRD
jgi:hypothetical protein